MRLPPLLITLLLWIGSTAILVGFGIPPLAPYEASLDSARFLILGGGGREHCLVWSLLQSPGVERVYIAPGNAGTGMMERVENVGFLNPKDHKAVIDFTRTHNVSMVIVGPEEYLITGIADALSAESIDCFGCSQKGARIEGDKVWAKKFMGRHSIPTAPYASFVNYDQARGYVSQVRTFPLVIKASGLAAGKGVTVAQNMEEAQEALEAMMVKRVFGNAGEEVIVEEYLEGEEVSLFGLSDGKKIACLPLARDFKRLWDGDKGPNTGGMGAICPVPGISSKLRVEMVHIMQQVISGMEKEGHPYKGVLYGGFMITAKGPYVLEFNCRFGDPETQAVLPLFRPKGGLAGVMRSCIKGTLNPEDVAWIEDGFCATVVAAKEGYAMPGAGASVGPVPIEKIGPLEDETFLFEAGTILDSTTGIKMAKGGRILAVSGRAPTLRQAVMKAYIGMDKVSFPSKYYRNDIGLKALRSTILNIGILSSTRGTSVRPFFDKAGQIDTNACVRLVLSNQKDAAILDAARNHCIPQSCIGGKTKMDFEKELLRELEDAKIDLLLLNGFSRILSPGFVEKWRGRCLNIHPSLLPDFAGCFDLEVHRRVLAAGKKESGCTIHFVTENVDQGPILLQSICQVLPDDKPESLRARVQNLETGAWRKAIQIFADGLGTQTWLKSIRHP